MIHLAAEDQCTGCMACRRVCPRSAIDVKQDALGGLIPQINAALCVECGKCRNVCPQINVSSSKEPSKAFAVWSLDPENRRTSTSGGAAAVLYEKALELGYWICGAEYTAQGRVVHTLTKEKSAIQRYKQSKYVFSEIDGVYGEIKKQLDAGEKVLVISLPCKIAGLLGFLQKPYENLLTVDIVCHGTPSGKLLTDHVQTVVPGAENFCLSFRSDNEYVFRVTEQDKIKYSKTGRTDTYLAAFVEGLSCRESCYHCSYAKKQRISDLTIGDFWGLGAELPFEHPYTGAVSVVLINTDRGQTLFDACRSLLFVEERPVSEAINGNAQLNAPTPIPAIREAFVRLHQQIGFENAVKKLLQPQMKAEAKKLRKRQIRMGIKKLAGVFHKRYRG